MAEPAARRKTRPRSPTLDAAHDVIRALGLRGGEGDPPQEDAGADSDLEIIPEPPAGSTPAEPAPPAGSVPAPCPAWKRGQCTGEDWCPKRHLGPSPDDGALPALGHVAARAALRYRVAQGWILDGTARGSVNIQEAVHRVAHTGQAESGLAHTGPPWRTGGGDRHRALGNGAGPGGRDGPRGAPRIRRAARAPTVDHPGVHPPTGVALLPHGRCLPSCGTWHRRTPPQAARRKSPGTSTTGRPTRISPGAGPGAASQWRPRQRGSASQQPSSSTPTRGHATSCRRGRSWPPRQTPGGDRTQGGRNR